MRKGAVTLLLVFAFAMYAAAWQSGSAAGQDTGQQTTGQHQSGGAAAAGEEGNSVMGCLQSSTAQDTWMIQTQDKGRVQVKVEDDLKNEISKHIGHTVRLTGEWEDAEGEQQIAEADRDRVNLPQADQPVTGEQREFKAERLDMIASACPEPGAQQAQPGSQPSPGANQPDTPSTQPDSQSTQPQSGPRY
jgi:hypothetical protein